MRIEITNYEKDYVSVDFEEGETLVNLNFRAVDLLKLDKLIEEAIEGLKLDWKPEGEQQR